MELMTMADVCMALQVSRKTVYRMIGDGVLPAPRKMGNFGRCTSCARISRRPAGRAFAEGRGISTCPRRWPSHATNGQQGWATALMPYIDMAGSRLRSMSSAASFPSWRDMASGSSSRSSV